MKRVILESPYKGDSWNYTKENIRYARLCMRDCILRGEAPFASHLLYTQDEVLDDKVSDERNLGIKAGFAWRAAAEATVVYINRGISAGMNYGIRDAVAAEQPFEYRILTGYPQKFFRPAIVTITGASGVGKTTILKRIFAKKTGAKFVQSFTSRSPRPSDLSGEYQYNVPKNYFEKNKSEFLWVVSAHGNLYGTKKQSVMEAFESRSNLRFLALTPEAVELLRGYLSRELKTECRHRLVSFFILSPGEKELRRRLLARSEKRSAIRQRMGDCSKWDENARKSGTPYIFLRNDDCEPEAAIAASQMSLFF